MHCTLPSTEVAFFCSCIVLKPKLMGLTCIYLSPDHPGLELVPIYCTVVLYVVYVSADRVVYWKWVKSFFYPQRDIL